MGWLRPIFSLALILLSTLSSADPPANAASVAADWNAKLGGYTDNHGPIRLLADQHRSGLHPFRDNSNLDASIGEDNFNTEFDFVVVGPGPGGSVAATLLSDNSHVKVAVIGMGAQRDFNRHDPATQPFFTYPGSGGGPFFGPANYLINKQYSNEPAGGNLGGAQQFSPLTEQLGGSMTVNGGVLGTPLRDYYDMIKSKYLGHSADWDYDRLLSLRRHLYTVQGVSNVTCQGTSGPVTLTVLEPNGLAAQFKQSLSNALGIPIADSLCSNSGATVSNAPRTLRINTSTTDLVDRYVRQTVFYDTGITTRSNVRIFENTQATGLEWDNHNPTQVNCVLAQQASGNGQARTIKLCPKKELILSMNAVENPKFLQRNGIGDCANVLAPAGVACKLNNSNVGLHLKDQVSIGLVHLGLDLGYVETAVTQAYYVSQEAQARGETVPDMQIASTYLQPVAPGLALYYNALQQTRHLSEGFVKILSSDARHDPFIQFGYAQGNSDDIPANARNLLNYRAALADLNARGFFAEELGDQTAYVTQADIENAIKTTTLWAGDYHFTGTTRLAAFGDPKGVCDPHGRIYGNLPGSSSNVLLKGVRLMSGSVMPESGSAHAGMSPSIDSALMLTALLKDDYHLW